MSKSKIKKLDFKGQEFFVGIDVHLKSWKITIRNNHKELKTFSMEPIPEQLFEHMRKNYPHGNYFSVYEAGFCGFWIHRRLMALGFKNIIVNPADVPTTNKEKDRKSDPIDSRKLARELENKSLKGIYIPSEKQQAFRTVARLYMQAVGDRKRIRLRIKSFLHYNGVKIPPEDQLPSWSGRFVHWLNGIKFTQQETEYHLKELIGQLEAYRKRTLEILKYMRLLAKENPIVALLRTIPGVGNITSFIVVAELMDMQRFKNVDRVASFTGIVPSVSGTGDKEKVMGLTNRHNKYLRKLIIEASWVAARKDPALTLAYNSYTNRMIPQKAIIRIAKKLISRMRYVWLNETEYVVGVVE